MPRADLTRPESGRESHLDIYRYRIKYKSLLIRIPPDLHGELSPSRTPSAQVFCASPMPLERAKDHRGVLSHAFCAPFLRISDAGGLIPRCLRSCGYGPGPCPRTRTGGGCVYGSDPPFSCLVRTCSPVLLRITGGQVRTPQGGSLPP